MKHRLLLINLGKPDNPSTSAVIRYLRTFLANSRVINILRVLRYLLLYGVILPLRARSSAHAYRTIWTIASVKIIRDFSSYPDFTQAQATLIQPPVWNIVPIKAGLAMN